ncbi:MAG: cellulase family glycosylhydrolase [Pseudomonadales bacterium]
MQYVVAFLLLALSIVSAAAHSAVRDRVQIIGNNVVADNGYPLRGTHISFDVNQNSSLWDLERMYSDSLWLELRDSFHLNTIRLMLSRPPQNWANGPGSDCFSPNYRCHYLNSVHPNGKSTLQIIDDLVNKAANFGMYIVIDYHPVGGYDQNDAENWWSTIAPRYKDRTHVIYELTNEPVAWAPNNYVPSDVAYQQSIFGYVRNLAPDTHLILWSFSKIDSGNLARSLVDSAIGIDYENASVGFHPYGAFNSLSVGNLRQQYPVINTESGGLNSSEISTRRDTNEQLGLSWIDLGGAKTDTYPLNPNGWPASEVYWPADPAATSRAASADTPLPPVLLAN